MFLEEKSQENFYRQQTPVTGGVGPPLKILLTKKIKSDKLILLSALASARQSGLGLLAPLKTIFTRDMTSCKL